ncbi:MAG TPA: glycosyltransferase family 4 protein, partial [archaeon]|nr:glycosyltransferase family 4 protein [archaeon]
FPTQYEPFGLVILEAMASGLPVVTTKLAGAAELIEDGKDGLLLDNPKSSDEIARKLNYLIENDAMRRKVGKNARKKAEKYTWKKTADEMLKVFEESIK